MGKNTEAHYDIAYEWFLHLKDDMRDVDIMRIINVSDTTLLAWKKFGRKVRDKSVRRPGHRRISDEKLGEIEAMLRDGVSHAEIRRTIGVSEETIHRYFPGTAWNSQQVIEYAVFVRKMNGGAI